MSKPSARKAQQRLFASQMVGFIGLPVAAMLLMLAYILLTQ